MFSIRIAVRVTENEQYGKGVASLTRGDFGDIVSGGLVWLTRDSEEMVGKSKAGDYLVLDGIGKVETRKSTKGNGYSVTRVSVRSVEPAKNAEEALATALA